MSEPSEFPQPRAKAGRRIVSQLVRDTLEATDSRDTSAASVSMTSEDLRHSLGVLAGLVDGTHRVGFRDDQVEDEYRRAAGEVRQVAKNVSSALEADISAAASVAMLLRMAGTLARVYGLDRRACARLASHFLQPAGQTRLNTQMLTELGEDLARSDKGPRPAT